MRYPGSKEDSWRSMAVDARLEPTRTRLECREAAMAVLPYWSSTKQKNGCNDVITVSNGIVVVVDE